MHLGFRAIGGIWGCMLLFSGNIGSFILKKFVILPTCIVIGIWFNETLSVVTSVVSFALSGIFTFFANWGISIIIFAILIRVLFWPLIKYSLQAQKQTTNKKSKIAPCIEEIKRTTDDHLEQYEKINLLYKEHGISPFSDLKSLVPLLIQIPIFLSLYSILQTNPALHGSPFLWIEDLAKPDKILQFPFQIPYFGQHLNLLPVLMASVNIISTYLMSNDPDSNVEKSQVISLYLMAIVFFIAFYPYPAGLVLYWTSACIVQLTHERFLFYCRKKIPAQGQLRQEKLG
jgi:YidC/Oxa1 family membrane protein insertase